MARKKRQSIEEPAEAEKLQVGTAVKAAPVVKAAVKPKEKEPEPIPEPTPQAADHKKTRRGGVNNRKKENVVDSTRTATAPMTAVAKEAADRLKAVVQKLGPSRGEVSGDMKLAAQKTLADVEMKLTAWKCRPAKSKRPSSQLRAELEELKGVPEFADQVPAKEREYVEAVAWEQYKAFLTEVEPLKEKISARIQVVAPKKMAEDLERLVRLLGEKKPGRTIDANEVHMRCIELPAEVMALLYKPLYIANKMSREYEVVVELPGGKGKGKGVVAKAVNICGFVEDVDRCIEAMKELDLSHQRTIECEGRAVAAIVGPGGQNSKLIERECGVYLATDGNEKIQKVTVYGGEDAVGLAVLRINEKKEAIERIGESDVMKVSVDKAKWFLSEAGKSSLRVIEAAQDCTFRVGNTGYDVQETDIFIRGRNKNVITDAKASINKHLASLSVVFVTATKGTVAKMFNARETRQTYEKLKERFQSTMTLLRKEEGVLVIGADADDVKIAQDEVNGLMLNASYDALDIPILFPQMRVFDDANRACIEKCGVEVSVRRGQEGCFLSVKGPEDAKRKAEEVVEDIIQREGTVETWEILEATVYPLIRGASSKLSEIQANFNVSATLNRQGLTMTLVGGKANIKEAKLVIDEIEQEEASQEQREVTVTQDDIPRIIGKGGSNIKKIRECGVTAEIDDNNMVLKLRGHTANLEEALELVMELISDEEDYVVPADADFQKRVRKEEPSPTPQAALKEAPKNVEINFGCEDLFPALGAGPPLKAKRSKAANAWGQKAVVAEPESPSAEPESPVAEDEPTNSAEEPTNSAEEASNNAEDEPTNNPHKNEEHSEFFDDWKGRADAEIENLDPSG